MKPNDIKKGMRIRQYNGTECEVMDNKKGNIRMLKVPRLFSPGDFDMGDTYVHDWKWVQLSSGEWEKIDHGIASDRRKEFINRALGR
jgi:hypothetical protein